MNKEGDYGGSHNKKQMGGGCQSLVSMLIHGHGWWGQQFMNYDMEVTCHDQPTIHKC